MRAIAMLILLIFAENTFANCKAILINGGANPANNHLIHTAQLREMYTALRAKGCRDEDIHVFSASGSTESPDFRVDPTAENSRYVNYSYNFNDSRQIKNLYPADRNTLKSKISQISSRLKGEDQLFIYVSDHGGDNGGTKGLVPWFTREQPSQLFTPSDLESALSAAPSSAKVKVWTECCYCGAFNRIKRPNTCVATSTDEFHVGSYNWTNWDQYSQGRISARDMTSKTYFAGQVKKEDKVSLTTAAKVSRNLTTQDARIQAATLRNNCFIGARDSLDQWMLTSLGFDSKPLCLKDVMKMCEGRRAGATDCGPKGPFVEIENLKLYLDQVQAQPGALNYTEKQKIRELAEELTSMGVNLAASSEYRRIQEINRKFHALTPQKQVSEAKRLQDEVAQLKVKMLANSGYFEKLVQGQKLLFEALFFARATPAQKEEYMRRKKCLDEPLF